MLSDEEREALRNFKSEYETCKYNSSDLIIELGDAKTILNLIEKQSKEIEELKKDKLELINKNHVVHLKDVEKELRKMRKVIDTKNAEIECLNVIHESYKEMVKENNFISKDKIKAKIEPKLKELDKNMKKEWQEYGNSREYQDMEDEWNFLQSLLGKK